MSALDEQLWQAWHDDAEPVRVGVSACLLGAEVRFDRGHKRDRYLTDVLGENVVWLPVCPELEMGLGAPRPVLQLRGGERGESLVVRLVRIERHPQTRPHAHIARALPAKNQDQQDNSQGHSTFLRHVSILLAQAKGHPAPTIGPRDAAHSKPQASLQPAQQPSN